MTSMDPQGKSRAISERLRQEILSGKFDATGKFPSDRMLMRRFAVARATVQAAMRDLLEKKLVDRKPGYGTFLTERASVAAARKFGVIMPDAYYPFYADISGGIEKAAKEQGWTILSAALGSAGMRDRALRAVEFAEVCKRERVSGVFFQPLQFLKDGERFNRAILKVFKGMNVPIVLLDSDFLVPPQRSEYDLVGVDNVGLGYELARHMISRGAKRIIYFSNPLAAPTSLLRGNGVSFAVTEAGLMWRKESVFFADPSDTTAARRVFASKKRPDAIIAVNDYIALKLLKTLTEIGVRVPDDCLLAGVNGEIIAEESDPPLTTAIQPCEQIGRAAVKMMLERLSFPDLPKMTVSLEAKLVCRKSTQVK